MLTDKQIMIKIIAIVHDCCDSKAESILWNDQEQQGDPYFDSEDNFTEVGKRSFLNYTKIISEIKSIATNYQSYKNALVI